MTLTDRSRRMLARGETRTGQPVHLMQCTRADGADRFEVYVGGWRVATLRTEKGARRRFSREETR